MADILLIEGDGSRPRDRYLREILAHAGLFFGTHDNGGADRLPSLAVLMGRVPSEELAARLIRHVTNGGALLALGDPSGLEAALGVVSPRASDGGWLELRAGDHPCVCGLSEPLHVFGGTTVAVTEAKELASLNGHTALAWNRCGKGFVAFLGADVVGSVVHIQQGIFIDKDGEPAPDGTAPIDDGLLKAEDGIVLDWTRDRQTVRVPRGKFPCVWGGGASPPDPLPPEDEPYPFIGFLEPAADNLRELLLKTIFALASATRTALTALWHWPRGLDGIAHLSHDSDGNDPDLAEALRQVCVETDIRSTWCMLYPGGYPPRFYRRLRDEGFEVALHYDALEGRGVRAWGRGNLAVQAGWLRDTTGVDRIRSNKNHYTRWEGRLEFFRWCEEEGIGLDQSKGPSKTGIIGFPFGSAHPWFPLDDESESTRFIDVLNLSFMTQDLVITAPAAYAETLTAAARKHYGVAHFLYHPAHILKPDVADSLRRLNAVVRASRMEWQTSAWIRDWEDARRSAEQSDEGALRAGAELNGAAWLKLLPDGADCPPGWERVERWGFPFAQRIRSLRAGETWNPDAA